MSAYRHDWNCLKCVRKLIWFGSNLILIFMLRLSLWLLYSNGKIIIYIHVKLCFISFMMWTIGNHSLMQSPQPRAIYYSSVKLIHSYSFVCVFSAALDKWQVVDIWGLFIHCFNSVKWFNLNIYCVISVPYMYCYCVLE